MASYAPLPAYQAGNALNFQPLSQGIDDLAAGIKQGRTNALNQQIGQAAASGDWKGAQAAAFGGGQIDQGMGIAKFKAQQDAAALDHEHRVAQHMAGISQMVLSAPPEQGRAMMQKLYQAQPDIAQHLTKYGIDPNDHQGAAKFMIAEARGYVNPQEEAMNKAKLGLIQAQTHSAYRADEPEIVRQMRAGGIDPKSPEGQTLIRNSIKGGSPIDQAIAKSMEGINAPPAAPQAAQQQGQVIPQSAPANALNPGIQLTAGGATNGLAQQPAPQAPPDPMADTPLGPMPSSKARMLGFGLAYQGKGEAGKMFNEAGNAAKLGKTGEGENDKNELGLTNQMGRLKEISSSFDPEYLKGMTQVGMWGRQMVSKWGTLPPADQEKLYKYATFRKDAASNLNKVLKEVSGTAVTESEMGRMLHELPNAGTGIGDGDDPVSFKAKMDRTVESVGLAIARARHLRNQGFQGKPWDSGIPIENMRSIINQRAQQIEGAITKANSGMAKPILDAQVDAAIKKEFGI